MSPGPEEGEDLRVLHGRVVDVHDHGHAAASAARSPRLKRLEAVLGDDLGLDSHLHPETTSRCSRATPAARSGSE